MATITYHNIRVYQNLYAEGLIRADLQVENHHHQLIGRGKHYRDGRCVVFICIPAYMVTVRFKSMDDMLQHMAELGFRAGHIDYAPTWVRYERQILA